MTKLKSCPFCGKEVKIKVTHDDHYVIECDNCNSSTSFPYLHLRDDIINAWNTRPNPWHTGTPKEEGLYWVFAPHGRRKYTSDCFVDGVFQENVFHTVAWQKLTPYEDK